MKGHQSSMGGWLYPFEHKQLVFKGVAHLYFNAGFNLLLKFYVFAPFHLID